MNEDVNLRDWFAGQALAGLLAYGRLDITEKDNDLTPCGLFADRCYKMADAMMKERSKGENND